MEPQKLQGRRKAAGQPLPAQDCAGRGCKLIPKVELLLHHLVEPCRRRIALEVHETGGHL